VRRKTGKLRNPFLENVVSKTSVFVVAKSKIWPVMLLRSLSTFIVQYLLSMFLLGSQHLAEQICQSALL